MSRTPLDTVLRTAARQLIAMLAVMTAFGLVPVFALMMSPIREGATRREILTGITAERFLESKMAENQGRREAFVEAERRLKAKGLTRSGVTVTRTYAEPAQQSLARRVAEWVVPTVHAWQYSQTMIWDDWSGYNSAYDGTMYVDDGSYHDIMMLVNFSKDPSTEFAVSSVDALWWSGWEPDVAPIPTARMDSVGARLKRLAQRMHQIILPTLDAKAVSKSWWDRLHDWATCTVTGCTTAASACFIHNVIDGEVLWVPCFTAWCGGAEVGCAVYAIIH